MTLPEDVSDDLRLVIDELESAIADMESRLESTRAERDEAKARQVELTIENAQLFSETRQSLARQTATSDILRVISQSPTDVQPVFDAIVQTAVRLLRCDRAFIQRCDATSFWTLASSGPDGPLPIATSRDARIDPDANFPSRAILTKKTVHLPDWSAIELPDHERRIHETLGINSAIFLPLLREGECIGLLAFASKRASNFGESDIALAESFRDQALIAIENVRLFNETREALERQTATADILKVIASSPDDVQPVFEAIAGSANRLLGGFSTAVFRFVDGVTHLAAFTSTNPAADEVLKSHFPRPLAGFEAFQLAQEGKPVPIADTETDQDERIREIGRTRGFRSMLFVPLVGGGATIGVISVTRVTTGSFADHHVTLLQTFADQAVIAIENVRLFNETKEALERQTATADILKVIASSPDDTTPVFAAIATSATRLLGGFSAAVFRFLDGTVHLAAFTPVSPAADAALKADFPKPVEEFEGFRLAQQGKPFPIADTEEMPLPPELKEIARLHGFRSMLFVPLMNGGVLIGIISVTRREPGAFSPNHTQLLQTFADQAVIAIENTRLFNETQEALERQTATGEILKVIASSPTDVQPVFDAIAASANRLIGGFSSTVMLFVRDVLQLVAFTPTTPTADEMLQASFPRPLAEFPPFELVRDGETVQFPDTESEDVAPLNRALARSRGYRGMLFTPLMSKGAAIGILSVTRKEPGAFAMDHVQLLRTFADQAVIAIENVRLFDEVQAKTRDLSESLQQQTATADVLKVISRSAFDLQTVFETLVESAAQLCHADRAAILRLTDNRFQMVATHGFPAEFRELMFARGLDLDRGSAVGRAALERRTIQIPDILADPEFTVFESQKSGGFRTVLGVPLLREGNPIGGLFLTRGVVELFTQQQIDLVTTFADQAVIAIENVRLFDEVQAKTRDLTEALTYQTGSSNILSVIASSPTDVTPVLNAIVESASKLCEAYDAVVLLKDGDDLRFSAHHGPIPINIEKWPINRNWASGRAFLDQEPVHVRDLLSDEGAEFPGGRELSRHAGIGVRTLLSVPLLRENESVGAILLRRTELHPFSDKQIALLQTFADQAVIAIGNVRLFDEVQARTRDLTESLQQQTATADVLRVISASPGELEPVFNAMLENAVRLCDAKFAMLILYEEEKNEFRGVASWNVPAAYGKILGIAPIHADPKIPLGRVAMTKRPVQVEDILVDESYIARFPGIVAVAELGGARTLVQVPMLKENELVGTIAIYRQEVRPFNDKQIELVQNFAAQAVIAIENARLLNALRQRTDDLTESLQQQTATSEVLKVISSSPGELEPVFNSMLKNAVSICDAKFGNLFLIDGDSARWEAGVGTPPALAEYFTQGKSFRPTPGSHLDRVMRTRQVSHTADDAAEAVVGAAARLGGARSTVCVPMVKDDALVGTIFIYRTEVRPFTDKQIDLVKNFAAQAVIAIENTRLLKELRQRTDDLTRSLDDLRTAQDRLVQTEKLASLGQLTAGIAHEIKNPLNFVNNFSALSAELTDELNDLLKSAVLTDTTRLEVDELTGMLKDNLEKVVQHGKRADSIVKNMLLHSREGAGEHRPADINALLDESLNLAYHGARAEKPQFNVTLQRDFDQKAGMIEVFPQEITRVFLNLISNGFYAVTKRRAENGNSGFEPLLVASTRNLGETVEIRIRDNGTGIPEEVREKMFNPFFTTKPAGEGTGLGLSMSHDIIVKQHGGRIDVATEPGQFTEFTILLPRKSSQTNNQSEKNGEPS